MNGCCVSDMHQQQQLWHLGIFMVIVMGHGESFSDVMQRKKLHAGTCIVSRVGGIKGCSVELKPRLLQLSSEPADPSCC